jgi:hypothetical protein
MNPKLKLSKLDCARRQLEMAIELYFMERDPVSIHTLAGAVRQILADINRHRGGKPLFSEVEGLKGVIIPGKEKQVAALFKKAQNFFKHADEDPEETIDFSPEANEIVLWESCTKHSELTSELTPTMKAMIIWFLTRHPDLFNHDESQKRMLDEASHSVKSIGKTLFFQEMLKSGLLRDFKY